MQSGKRGCYWGRAVCCDWTVIRAQHNVDNGGLDWTVKRGDLCGDRGRCRDSPATRIHSCTFRGTSPGETGECFLKYMCRAGLHVRNALQRSARTTLSHATAQSRASEKGATCDQASVGGLGDKIRLDPLAPDLARSGPDFGKDDVTLPIRNESPGNGPNPATPTPGLSVR